MVDDEDDGFIGMPPGIFDSGTFKLPPKVERPRAERDEIVFVSTVPGMPVPPVADPEPEVAPESEVAPEPEAAPAADAWAVPASHETQRAIPDPAETPQPEPAPAPAPAGWRLVLADGTEVALAGTTLVGRNPAPFDAWPGAALLPVDDTTKSVSKTHAAFELDDSGLWVHDLNSTNGVWVVHGEGVTEVAPGRRVNVHPGSSIELGDYVLTVTR